MQDACARRVAHLACARCTCCTCGRGVSCLRVAIARKRKESRAITQPTADGGSARYVRCQKALQHARCMAKHPRQRHTREADAAKSRARVGGCSRVRGKRRTTRMCSLLRRDGAPHLTCARLASLALRRATRARRQRTRAASRAANRTACATVPLSPPNRATPRRRAPRRIAPAQPVRREEQRRRERRGVPAAGAGAASGRVSGSSEEP